MSDQNPDPRVRLEDLLAEAAVSSLSVQDQQELASLRRKFPQWNDESFELAAAAVHLADESLLTLEELPSSIRETILRDAERLLESSRTVPNPSDATVPGLRRSQHWMQWSGWGVAAALVIVIGLSRFSAMRNSGVVPIPLAQQRDELLKQEGTLRVAWADGLHPFATPVSGDVLWNQADQSGFLSFEGLPVNDPEQQQYQLWIIDPQRDDQPIDGGVFDITQAEGRVIVPITPKLQVIAPSAFAVTVEKPGGVVVSDQKQLPLLAQVR